MLRTVLREPYLLHETLLTIFQNEVGFGEINSADFTFAMPLSNPVGFGSAEERDIRRELLNDIDVFCRKWDGSQVQRGQSQEQCTDWADTKPEHECKQTCEAQCPYVPSQWGLTGPEALDCIKECPMVVAEEKANSVYYKATHDHEDDEVHGMTYQTCYDGFAKGSEDCPRGGESEHEEFWFKIDPNSLACAAMGFFD